MSEGRIDDDTLALYALDALGDDERAAVEAAVAASPRLAAKLDEHLRAAGALGAATELTPPPDLKSRVMAAAFADRPPKPVEDTELPEIVVPMESRRRSRTISAVVAGFAVAATLVLAVLLANRHDADRVTASAELRGTGPAVLDAVVRSGGRLTLTGHDLPGIDAAHTYQLWLIDKDAQVRSAGLFSPGDNGTVTARFDVDLQDAAQLAVTVEPAGGSPKATGAIEFQGALT